MADNLILIFSGLVALSTLVYAMLTWRLVTETRRMREVQTEPKVSVRAELSQDMGHGAIDLVIRNEGQGPAENVRFRFEGDPTYFDKERPVDQIPILKNGLPYLGSNQTFRITMGFLFGNSFTRATETPWTIQTEYENQAGKSKTDIYIVDFSQFSQLIVGGGSPLFKIEKHLESFQRDFHRVASDYQRLNLLKQLADASQKEGEQSLIEQRDQAGNNAGQGQA